MALNKTFSSSRVRLMQTITQKCAHAIDRKAVCKADKNMSLLPCNNIELLLQTSVYQVQRWYVIAKIWSFEQFFFCLHFSAPQYILRQKSMPLISDKKAAAYSNDSMQELHTLRLGIVLPATDNCPTTYKNHVICSTKYIGCLNMRFMCCLKVVWKIGGKGGWQGDLSQF